MSTPNPERKIKRLEKELEQCLETIRLVDSQCQRHTQYLSLVYHGSSSRVLTKDYPHIAAKVPGGSAAYPSLIVIDAPVVGKMAFPCPKAHDNKYHHLHLVGPGVITLVVEDYTERYQRLYRLGERYLPSDEYTDLVDFL